MENIIKSPGNSMEKHQGGFTLTEVLVTMLILGILAAISVPLYIGQKEKAVMSEAKENLESIRLLLENYYNENGCYRKSSGACSNTAITATDGVMSLLPGFKPGNLQALKFTYTIAFSSVGGSAAQAYTITATGGLSGNSVLSVDQNNSKLGF